MDMLVRPVPEPSTTRPQPVVAASPPDDRTWAVCGALFCLLLIARLTGSIPLPAAAGVAPAPAVALPTATPPAAPIQLHVVSRI